MTTNLFADVRRFALVAGSPHFLRPGVDKQAALTLYRRLIEEEVVKEFLPDFDKWRANPSTENLVKVVDGALDGIYVLIFFLNQMGFDGQRMWDVVQAANMAKFPGGVAIKDMGGKVVKPAGWKPPDEVLHTLLIEYNTMTRGEKFVGGLNKPLEPHENPEVSEQMETDRKFPGYQPD